jgi:hypothetical protein
MLCNEIEQMSSEGCKQQGYGAVSGTGCGEFPTF